MKNSFHFNMYNKNIQNFYIQKPATTDVEIKQIIDRFKKDNTDKELLIIKFNNKFIIYLPFNDNYSHELSPLKENENHLIEELRKDDKEKNFELIQSLVSIITKYDFTLGFTLSNQYRNEMKDMSVFSLCMALKSYFSSYKVGRLSVGYLKNFNESGKPSFKYVEMYMQTIFHFHHFFELILKEKLKRRHKLLPLEYNKDIVLIDDLLLGREVNDDRYSSLKFASFSEILKRFKSLYEKDKTDSPEKISDIEPYIGFIDDIKTLNVLNDLRNKIYHQGNFILYYKHFDILIGKYVLPMALKIMEADRDKDDWIDIWRYDYSLGGKTPNLQLHCKIDIFEELRILFKSEIYAPAKIALIKELGRASYIKKDELRNRYYAYPTSNKNRDEIIMREFINIDTITECPVCAKDFYIFKDRRDNNDEEYITKCKCFYCTFEIDEELVSVAKEYSLI